MKLYLNCTKSRDWTDAYRIVIRNTNRPIGVEPRCKMDLVFIYVKYASGNIISQVDTGRLLWPVSRRIREVAKSDC
jgi:hypothetical protein